MPRSARVRTESGLYHIVVQGARGRRVFENPEDKLLFIDRLLEYKTKGEVQLFAFAVFENHAHLVLNEGPDGLSALMRRIGVSFSHRYKKLHPGDAPVFRDRYQSEPLELWQLPGAISFVETEAVRRGLCSCAEDYPYSSAGRRMQSVRVLPEVAEEPTAYGRTGAAFLEEISDKYGKSAGAAREALERRLGPHPREVLAAMSFEETEALIRSLRFEDQLSIRLVCAVTGLGRGRVQRVSAAELRRE